MGPLGDNERNESVKPVHQEIIQYEDGETALGFRTEGDSLTLGMGSQLKHGRDFYGGDVAVIRTESGNRYGIGYGLVMSERGEKAWDLPAGQLDITIGKELSLFDIATTTPIRSVQLRSSQLDPERVDIKTNAPNPFKQFDEQARATYGEAWQGN